MNALRMVDEPLLAHLGRAGILTLLDEHPSQLHEEGGGGIGGEKLLVPLHQGFGHRSLAMKATTRPLLAWLLLGVVGCHEGGATQAKLKSTYEDFELKARWGEAAAVAQLLIPERRSQFLAARSREHTDLNITDIELVNVVPSDDGSTRHGDLALAVVPAPLHLGAGRRVEGAVGRSGRGVAARVDAGRAVPGPRAQVG